VGPQVTATINGTLVLDVNTSEHVARLPEYTGLTRTSGYIGLEDHGEDGVEFRNIRIRTIGTPDNEEDALAALQGTWTAVGQEIGGNAWSQEQLAQHEKTITLADDTFEIRYRDRSGQFQVERGTYRLDLTHDPAHITMNGTNRDGGAIEFAGIYQVEGDQLRHCFVKTSDNGAVRRPTSFSTSAGQFATTYRRASAGPAAWTDLLNGTDLSGWAPVASDGAWSVKDGVLSATPGDGWLATDRDYGDFELELDYRIPPDGNTGVFLRAPLSGSPAGIGLLEVQAIDDSAPAFQNVPDRNHTGAVVGLFAASPRADAPPNRWNSLSIRCVGSKITVVVNGRKVSEGDLNNEPEAALKPDMKLPRGRIGLQRRTATGVEFRNIRVREL
jgi:uncharacterized protein (TIGR03067 family)